MQKLKLTVLLAALLLAPALRAQEPPTVDLSGTWNLSSEVSFIEPRGTAQDGAEKGIAPVEPCLFQGQATVMQETAGDLSGQASLMLVTGPAECPSQVSATVQGLVSGTNVEMGMLMGGDLGMATFGGQADMEGKSIMGTFFTNSGPYAGSGGPFSGNLGASVLPIPALDTLGLAFLALLLGTVAWLTLSRTGTA